MMPTVSNMVMEDERKPLTNNHDTRHNTRYPPEPGHSLARNDALQAVIFMALKMHPIQAICIALFAESPRAIMLRQNSL